MMEYALFTKLVQVGQINPKSEADYPGYSRLPYSAVSEYITFPISQPITLRCAAVMVGNVVMAVREFNGVE